jgi:Zn-dependent protease
LDIKNIFLQGNYSDLTFAVSGSLGAILFLICTMIVTINVFLAFFNLIPIPPLDGSKLLMSILPLSNETKLMLEQYGFFILLIVIFLMGGFLGYFLSFVLSIFFNLVIGV